jgi:hypothetical protein
VPAAACHQGLGEPAGRGRSDLPWTGLFVEALIAELARRGLAVPVSEVTLPAGPMPTHTPPPADRNDRL